MCQKADEHQPSDTVSMSTGTLPVKMALFFRDGGSILPCSWSCPSEIYKEFQKKKILASGILEERYWNCKKKDVTVWLQECVGGVDAFFECTGRNEVFSWGVDSARPEGKAILVGNLYADMTLCKGGYWKILRNQLTEWVRGIPPLQERIRTTGTIR